MKKSGKIALGGIVSALSIVILFLSNIFPFVEYAIPMIAGALMIIIMVEMNRRWAFMVYAGVSLLSLILVANPEPKVLYIAFFGLYPILKSDLERIPSRVGEWAAKLLFFNTDVLLAALAVVFLFRVPVEDFNEFGRWTIPIFAVLFNFVFVVYDIALSRVITLYLYRAQDTLHRIFK